MTSIDLGLLVLRVVAGLVFAAHGAQKAFGWWSGPGFGGWQAAMERMGIHPARPWALVSVVTELAGGVLLALGLLTPLVTALLVGQSIVILAQVHVPKGFWNRDGGFEFPLTLAAAVVALVATGPGAASLDAAGGLAYSPALRVALLALGVVGGVIGAAIPRLAARHATQAAH